MSDPLRLGVLCDFAAEGWPSMDLCADMLLAQLALRDDVEARRVQPGFRRRASSLPGLASSGFAFNADRVFNRYYDYPRALGEARRECQAFHLVDHSYSQLVLSLPPERSGVFCHDLDTFRCLLEPERDPRPSWYLRLVRSTLRGFTSAALVFHTTQAVRDELLRHALVPAERLVHAPLGVAPEFRPRPHAEDQPAEGQASEAGQTGAAQAGPRTLLHVGSCIPRKRVDVLLQVFAALRKRFEDLRLVKVGGEWSPEQRELLEREGLGPHVEHLTGLTREELCLRYQDATLVLHPSDAEGFGLPLIEALACGATVVASAIPAHEEVGGKALVYCAPGRVGEWVDTCANLLEVPRAAPAREVRLERAKRFSWAAHAERIAEAYRAL